MSNSRPAPVLALKCRRDARSDTLETCSAIWHAEAPAELMSEVVYGGVEWNRREAVAIAGEC
ncbi:hypothetical protein, partial [Burkholderia ubonensis]|uniref:hypothetical protein n=1 Tax=Burkholderia ubonensis TaxID=101571 RepID=UPI001E6384D8